MQNQPQQIEERLIDTLKPHPRQNEFFRLPLPCEIEELAADLRGNGQLVPLEILPDGTIICGHKRLAAARHLAWSHVKVWVRHDLDGMPNLVLNRLLEDNLNRRHFDDLDVGRVYMALRSIKSRSGGRVSAEERGDLRDRIGKRLGLSGRKLDRLLRIIEGTPSEVQLAVSEKKLPLSAAEKVAGLPRAKREQIASEIRAGGHPRDVVNTHLNDGAPTETSTEVQSLIAVIERTIRKLEHHCTANRAKLSSAHKKLVEALKLALRFATKSEPRRK